VVEYVSANDFAFGTFQRSQEDSVCNDVSEGSRDPGTILDQLHLCFNIGPLIVRKVAMVLQSPATVMSDESVEYESNE
jgi:hypothetical protein